jgi:hypothetical protein
VIDSAALLADLKKQLKLLQVDLRERAEDPDDAWGQRLREQHSTALERGRTGHAWVTWRDGEVDQAAVAWLVATTFIRFCEDNDLLVGARGVDGRVIPVPWVAGPGVLLERALEHETAFFTQRPSANRRDWLQEAFKALAAQPAGRALVDPRHSLVWSANVSAEAADGLVAFWRSTDTDGYLVHEFTDPDLDTRFLGDLYQDLSEYAKKTYALLQTPVFVEEFILDQTLIPAVGEFGLGGLKVIDPTCGSGHFLLGAFHQLNRLWADEAPGLDVRERVQRAMDSIHGVDVNPFAVAIARFRLTVAGLRACGIQTLVEAPDFKYHLAVGDSLLGAHTAQLELALGLPGDDEDVFEYDAEDLSEYHGILKTGKYHVVVGNPPYITPKDKALNQAYRDAYPMCAGKYALSVPFLELFFKLLIRGEAGNPGGYSGQITSNSFMKREFGKKVIETLLAGHDLGNPVDLTHVIDTSGAYIPGHGTPTVILIGRRRRPEAETVRAVLGVRGEPGTPADPARGQVWSEILEHINTPAHDGAFISVASVPRATFGSFPWSLSGGGAADLIELIEGAAGQLVGTVAEQIGISAVTGEDSLYMVGTSGAASRLGVQRTRRLVEGETVRDFHIGANEEALWPYTDDLQVVSLDELDAGQRRLYSAFRSAINRRRRFGTPMVDRGLPWWEWQELYREKLRTPLTITFAFQATHNHFVLDRGGKVFNRTAPVIKLSEHATEQQHLDLIGVLNSSTACFWFKQVSQNRGDSTDSQGARVTGDPAFDTYEFTSANVGRFRLPADLGRGRGEVLDRLARLWTQATPATAVRKAAAQGEPVADGAHEMQSSWEATRGRMIFEQEELDWEVYRLYGFVDEDLTYSGSWSEVDRRLCLGERAFEIALARKLAQGTEESAWFRRHGSAPIVEVPEHWAADYRALVERRLDAIASNKAIRLLERPEFKRRWATRGWDALLKDALNEAILDRLEEPDLWSDGNGQPLTRSVGELADAVRNDAFLVQCARLLAGSEEIDLTEVLTDVLKDEPVPYLAALRYKPSGLEKYRAWQVVWDLQRREDAGETVTVPVPPKYGQADFLKTGYWRARGKLDVPKERFINYPGVVRTGDTTPVLGWAGWDHAQQAQALARELGTQQGLGAEREQLLPLVAGLVELEPWLDQWHGEIDPRYGQSPANLIHQTVESYAGQLGVTRDDLDAWRPPPPTRGRRRATA